MNRFASEAVEETNTIWRNPTASPQIVEILAEGNVPRKYTVPPGGEREIPSRYDSAVHRVLCSQDECLRAPPGFCRKPHEHAGTILGGLAPLLQRSGVRHKLSDALDPELQAKKALEAEQAAALVAKTKAEDAMVIAEAKKIEIDKKRSAAK